VRLVIGVLHEALAVSTEKQLENDAHIAYTVNAVAAGFSRVCRRLLMKVFPTHVVSVLSHCHDRCGLFCGLMRGF
jgi:hypothetical protein